MAALTAALMSTVDTLINAVSAVTVNDIYKPYLKPKANDRHYLTVARIVSLSAALVGIALVPVFASFQSIYEAHGTFTAAVTPPMVVAIVLGAFWKRYTPKAAFWTLAGGMALVGCSLYWPALITPLGHGVDPAGGFKYMRALFGLVTSLVIAVTVTYLTRPKPLDSIQGLVVGTLNKGKEKFKGGKPNETPGKKVCGRLEVRKDVEGLSLPPAMMERLSAEQGDLVHIEDGRRWLGGIRSVHAKLGALHNEEGVILISPALQEAGSLLPGRKHRVEKIF
jgi:hypothetical protein